ncbi:MAG: DUF4331 domain-containing protein [Chitinophagaceae bacterium]|nr:MAG: DUF4331 domain-containing protein [Chitinophagaceae bacterium]
MKRKVLFVSLAALTVASGIIYAADHLDAPSLINADGTAGANDISDTYVFQSPADNSKMVFVLNWQGLMSPARTAAFNIPNNQLFEINIDNTGDMVEDLVIQAKVQDGKFRVYGPVAPASTGLNSTIVTGGPMVEGTVTAYGSSANPSIAMGNNGIKAFIGPRDDPFFFDLTRFKEIIGGTATSFRSPGIDAFAGTNVLSLVVEVPKTMLGSAQNINVWSEIKTK